MNMDFAFQCLVWYVVSRTLLHYFWSASHLKWVWRVLLRKQLWIPFLGEILLLEHVLPSMFFKVRPVVVFARIRKGV